MLRTFTEPLFKDSLLSLSKSERFSESFPAQSAASTLVSRQHFFETERNFISTWHS